MNGGKEQIETTSGADARSGVSRRNILKGAAGAAAAAAVVAGNGARIGQAAPKQQRDPYRVTNGRIHQSVCHWCFNPMTVESLARNAAKMGLESVELVGPKDWPILKKHGLRCAITGSHGFVDGMNRKENHDTCLAKIRAAIDASSEAGFPNVITFSGMRKGMPDDVGLDNTVLGLKKIIGYAEKKKVTLCLEVLNSRVDTHPMKGHPDYMCDKVEWAVEVCDRIDSERMKILFDIYHVQIMQGDVITRIRKYHKYVGHYHTAGVPGRGEINGTQELNYAPIMKAIVETGYKGFVGQEFIPTWADKMASLREAVKICDV